jgi:hypothetical protein
MGRGAPGLRDSPQLDLIVTMDDATSEILSMFVVEEEGTASTFRALREVVLEHGLFCELYTDLGSHYFYTPEPGAPSKVGRAFKQLGVRHIGPIHQKPEGDRSACSARCRTVFRRNSGWLASRRLRLPTSGLRPISPSIMRALQSSPKQSSPNRKHDVRHRSRRRLSGDTMRAGAAGRGQ